MYNQQQQPDFRQPGFDPPYGGEPGYGYPQAGNTNPGWNTVKAGLVVQIVSVLLFVVSMIAIWMTIVQATMSAVGTMAPGATSQQVAAAMGGPAGIMQMMQGAAVFGLLVLVASVGYIISVGMYLGTPTNSGIRGQGVAAFVTLIIAVVCMIGMVMVSAGNAAQMQASGGVMSGTSGPAAGGAAIMMLGMLLNLVSWFLSVRFLGSVARYFGAESVGKVASATIIVGLIGFLLPFVSAGRMPGLAALGGFALLATFVLYIVLMFQVRGVIARGHQVNSYAYPVNGPPMM